MKILWVKTDFLHPTNRGGQIRTLEMLRQLHRRHEVHYVAFDNPETPEGLARSNEYSSFAYPVPHQVTSKTSPRFALDLIKGLFAQLPVSGTRWASQRMRDTIQELEREHSFDAKVCDFLFPAVNIPDLSTWTIFQHNVESVIWERHAESGRTPVHWAYFAGQARKMLAWEKSACLSASSVIAVSDVDEQMMRARFGVRRISAVPTGVDTEYFARPEGATQQYDLVFVGSMDWMPNSDGIRWFLNEVLPEIRLKKPGLRMAVVGRNPPAGLATECKEAGLEVTGTVPDVRPYLWNAAISIVPLRIGGGTRLKIFEAMAAGTAVVSTTIGAEGLPVENGKTIAIADKAVDFANACVTLLENADERNRLSRAALRLVVENYSWERVTDRFEQAMGTSKPPVNVLS